MNDESAFRRQITNFTRKSDVKPDYGPGAFREFGAGANIPILAVLPSAVWSRDIRPFVAENRHSAASIAINQAYNHLTSGDTAAQKRILVTSATTRGNKSSVAFNLALAAAQNGIRVVLIDGDLFRRKLTRSLQENVGAGLCDVVKGNIETSDALIDFPGANLAVLPATKPDRSDTARITEERFRENVLGGLKNFDAVIVDGGPLDSSDAADVMARALDHIVVVAKDDANELGEVEQMVSASPLHREKNFGVIAFSPPDVRPALPAISHTNNDVLVLQMADQPEGQIGEQIRDLFSSLVERWWIVGITTILTVAMALFYIWTTTPLFSSHVEILIDPRERRTVESEIAPTGLGSSAAGADTLLLESQVEVLRSQKVTDALIRSENLTSDPEFAGGEASRPIEILKTIVKAVIYGPQDRLWQKTSAYDRTVSNLRKRTDVERQRNTYVIGVTVRSSDPQKAARLSNRLAQIYIAETNTSASDATRDTAGILESKLAKLRQIANKSAQAVETYKQQNSLINAGQTLLVEQRLNDLNRELAQARTELQSASSLRNQVRAMVESGNGRSFRLSEIGQSTVLSRLQTRLAEVEGQVADMESVFLTSHPALIRARERKEALLNSIRREYQRILSRLDVAYETALENASALNAEVGRLELKMAASDRKSVQLRELEREADASRAVYESFLRRSKEAREQIDIPNSTARIISQAHAASKPSHPAVFTLLAGAIAFGMVLGLIAALLHTVVSRAPISARRHRHPTIESTAAPMPNNR